MYLRMPVQSQTTHLVKPRGTKSMIAAWAARLWVQLEVNSLLTMCLNGHMAKRHMGKQSKTKNKSQDHCQSPAGSPRS